MLLVELRVFCNVAYVVLSVLWYILLASVTFAYDELLTAYVLGTNRIVAMSHLQIQIAVVSKRR